MKANKMEKNEIKIKLKAYDSKLIDSASKKIIDVVTATGASIYGPVPLPTHREVFTVLRAVHKYKKSREQFELRTHKRLIGVTNFNQETMDKLDRLVLPSGINIEIRN